MSIDPLTAVFALVALVTCWKLWSVLGTRNSVQKPPVNPFVRQPPPKPTPATAPQPTGAVVRLPGAAPDPALPDPGQWDAFVEPQTQAKTGLDAIAAADPTFAAAPFLEGAKSAYEAILAAFAGGDRKALQGLLAPDVYQGFAAALTARESARESLTTTIVSLDSAKIDAASLDGRIARLAVRFASKQIVATQSADGTVMDGSTDKIADVRDLWTFMRDVKSRDPNWKLAGTQAGH